VVLDPQAHRHAGGADIGGVGEDLGDREHAVLRVEVVDCELAVLKRMAGIEGGLERDLAGVECHREGERLEGRAHLVHAGGEPVNAGRIERLARIVGVVIGYRDH
jgi:hypothetical protein